jgi:hypothetical protein
MICHQCNAIMALVDRGERSATGPTANYLANAWHKSRPPKIRKFPRSPCPDCGRNTLWSRKTGLFHRHAGSNGAPCSRSKKPATRVALPPREERRQRQRHLHRHRSVVLRDQDWFAGGVTTRAMGITRGAVIEQFWRWYLRVPGAELPERPPRELVERATEEWRARQAANPAGE